MIVDIAWKNIWRSKLRSLVVIVSIAVGLLGGITAVSFMNGLLVGRIDDALQIEVSSMQIHNSEFMANSETEFIIPNTTELISNLQNLPQVKSVSKRLKVETMLSSNRAASGVVLMGIEPDKEKLVTDLYKKLVDSNSFYFENVKRRPILIGQKLAEKLKVHVRSKIAINTVDVNGVSTKGVYRVVGIFKTQNAMFDETSAFIRYSDMQNLLSIKNDDAHEIAIMLNDMLETTAIKDSLKQSYSKYRINEKSLLKIRNDSIPENIYTSLVNIKSEERYSKDNFDKIISKLIDDENYLIYQEQLYQACEVGLNISEWKNLAPELAMQSTWSDLILYVFVGIILAALGFGIVNTMLMVVLERVREIGMLMAIGMNSRKIFRMIVLESVLLSLVGGVVGIIISWLAVSALNTYGVDMSMFSEGLEAIGYSSQIYPFIELDSYIKITLMVTITGVLAAIYPAMHAIKLNPSEAIRKD